MKPTPQFSIPIKAHVKQYLLKEFGPEPLNIHQNTFMGRAVCMKVEKKQPYRQLSKPEPPAKDGLLISLPTALKHYTLTVASGKEVGDMLNKFFQQQLVLFVKGQVAVTGNERAALRCFYELYDINPSDYDLEEARKVYRDYKDRVMKANGHYDLLYAEAAVAS